MTACFPREKCRIVGWFDKDGHFVELKRPADIVTFQIYVKEFGFAKAKAMAKAHDFK